MRDHIRAVIILGLHIEETKIAIIVSCWPTVGRLVITGITKPPIVLLSVPTTFNNLYLAGSSLGISRFTTLFNQIRYQSSISLTKKHRLIINKKVTALGTTSEIHISLRARFLGYEDLDNAYVDKIFRCVERTIRVRQKPLSDKRDFTRSDEPQDRIYGNQSLPPTWCPICSSLPPLDNLPLEPNMTPFEYPLNLDPLTQDNLRI